MAVYLSYLGSGFGAKELVAGARSADASVAIDSISALARISDPRAMELVPAVAKIAKSSIGFSDLLEVLNEYVIAEAERLEGVLLDVAERDEPVEVELDAAIAEQLSLLANALPRESDVWSWLRRRLSNCSESAFVAYVRAIAPRCDERDLAVICERVSALESPENVEVVLLACCVFDLEVRKWQAPAVEPIGATGGEPVRLALDFFLGR